MNVIRMNRFRVRAGLATAAVVAAVLAGAPACTGSSTPAASSTPGASVGGGTTTSSPSAAGTVSLPSVTTSAAGVSSSTPAASPAGANAAPCGNGDIAVSLGRAGAAMNHAGQAAVFKNVSNHTCTLQGYPGAAVMSGGHALVNATRELNGFIGDGRQLSSAPLVTLQPGQSASAELEWVGNAGEKCYANGSGGLAITPPNTTKSTSLEKMDVGTNGICAGFQVHPVIAGIINN